MSDQPRPPRRFRLLGFADTPPEFRRGMRVGMLIGLALVLLLVGYCALAFSRGL